MIRTCSYFSTNQVKSLPAPTPEQVSAPVDVQGVQTPTSGMNAVNQFEFSWTSNLKLTVNLQEVVPLTVPEADGQLAKATQFPEVLRYIWVLPDLELVTGIGLS